MNLDSPTDEHLKDILEMVASGTVHIGGKLAVAIIREVIDARAGVGRERVQGLKEAAVAVAAERAGRQSPISIDALGAAEERIGKIIAGAKVGERRA
jgi:hypothetical protein